MKNGILKVLVNVIILLVILVVMDVVVGWGGAKYIKWLSHKPIDGDAALVNYNINSAKPDVAILGSSTAICHYDPDIIHDSLLAYCGNDYEVFNMGVSNQRLTYDYYGLKCLLDRATPKIVIVDVWASYIGEGDQSFSFEAFRPHANINPNIKEMLKKHDEYGVVNWSNMYCYNTELVKLAMSVFKSGVTNGFSRNKVEKREIDKQMDKDTTALFPLSMEEFDGIIGLSKEKGFQLFVVMSPTLRASDTTSLSYQYIKGECEKNDVPFLDYSNDEGYYQTHYFRDNTHLNFYGAEVFTQKLMKDIKKYIISKNNN